MRRSNQNIAHDPMQSGQIAVVILLVVVVLATLGLSQISQTTEDLFISSQREEATRVFNAAETGVEEALSEEGNFTTAESDLDEFTQDDSVVNVSVTPEDDLNMSIAEGEAATFNLVGASTVSMYWSSTASECDAASLMVGVYSDDGAGNSSVRYVFVQPNNCGDFVENRQNDEFINSGGSGNGYNYSYTFSPGPTDVLARITALYASTDILVTGNSVPQAHTVRSTAQTDVSGDESAEKTIEQKINVLRTMPAAPAYMNYTLYTNGDIQQAD